MARRLRKNYMADHSAASRTAAEACSAAEERPAHAAPEEEEETSQQDLAGRMNSMPPGLFEPQTGDGNRKIPMEIKEIV